MTDGMVMLCKYRISNMVIMNGDYSIYMDASNVLAVEYINDYDTSIFSVLKVTLRLDVRKRMYMLAHKRDIRCKFELDSLGYDVDLERAVSKVERVFSQVFAVYFNDDDEAIDEELLKKRLAQNNTSPDSEAESPNDENYFESQNTIDIYLFNQDLLTASRFNYGAVHTSTTLQNAIGSMLTTSKHRRVLMSKIENNEVYKELLIPSNPVFKCLLYLDQYYGLYERGAMIYYDIDVLYILNTKAKLTACRKDEWTETTFRIPKLERSVPGSGMIRVEGEKIFYPTVAEADVNVHRSTAMKNASFGSKIKLVSIDGTDISEYNANQSYVESQNTVVGYVRNDSKYSGSVMQARMEENETIIYITGNNLDISAFKPNKLFHIVYENPTSYEKYKGTYRLSYAYHVIRVESETFSSASHHLIMKKIG